MTHNIPSDSKDELHHAKSVWPGSVRRFVFALCRRMKAEGMQADYHFLLAWHRDNQQLLGGLGFDDFRQMVHVGISNVRQPAGSGDLADALAEADRLPAPACAARYSEIETRRLVGLCAVLQNRDPRNPIFLAGRAVAEVLSLPPVTAARRLSLLVMDGVLELVSKGRASEYLVHLGDVEPAPQQSTEINRIRIEQEDGSIDPGPFRIQIGTKEIEVVLIDVVGTSIQVRECSTGYVHMVPLSAVKPDCLPQVLAAVNAHPGRNQVLEFEDGQRLASAIRYGNPPGQ